MKQEVMQAKALSNLKKNKSSPRNEIHLLLKKQGYFYDPESLVWCRPGAESIEYSDGIDVELKLESIVKGIKDRSVESAEWIEAISDWPTEYHFSPKRANLLKPFAIREGKRIVELGAGCGAITRWLGETKAEVIAIEGSLRRAKIAALRCQDLQNVYVIADNLHATSGLRADLVTLIGVLEYSRIFSKSNDPVATVLDIAKQHLHPKGALIVAIENQLGLKYFAGCGEDHIGTPYFGIEDLYQADGAITFGRSELSAHLDRSGFSSQRLLLPFPDYKLPNVILDISATEKNGFDSASLVGLNEGRDYAGHRNKVFTETLAWAAVARNGMLPDMANSFLYVAAKNKMGLATQCPINKDFAWSFSGERSARFATITSFKEVSNGIVVNKALVNKQAQKEKGKWFQSFSQSSKYHAGERLDIKLIRAAASNDTDLFFKCTDLWISELLSHAKKSRGVAEISSIKCSGDTVDLIPRNIIVNANNELSVFDQEWHCNTTIPLVWLLFRGVLSFALYPVNGNWFRSKSIIELARVIAERHNLSISDKDIEVARTTDASFLSWVRDQDTSKVKWPIELLTTSIDQLTPNLFEQLSLQDKLKTLHAQEINRLNDAERIAHAKLIGAYEQAEKSNKSLIAELNNAHSFATEVLTRQKITNEISAEIKHQNSELAEQISSLESGNQFQEIRSELEKLLDAERIAHAKLIGAYERSEASNQSLISELSKANAYAAEMQANRLIAEQRVQEYEGLNAALAANLAKLENKNPLAERLISVENDLELARLSFAKLSGAYESEKSSNQALNSQLSITKSLNFEVLQQKMLAESKIDEYQNKIFGQVRRISELEYEIDSKINEINKVQLQLLETCEQNKSIQTQLYEVSKTVVSLQYALDLGNIERNRVQTQLLETIELRDSIQTRLDEVSHVVVDLDTRLTNKTSESLQLQSIVDQLQSQQIAINQELIRLNAERSTVGAKLGRRITNIRGRLAPVGTYRGSLVTLLNKFAASLIHLGFVAATSKAWRYILFRARVNRSSRKSNVAPNTTTEMRLANSGFTAKIQSNHPDLSAWIDANEPSKEELIRQIIESGTFQYRPLISVIIPVFKVPREVLEETLSCLEFQTYSNWEACIVWSDTTDAAGWEWLKVRCVGDSRFKFKLLSENGGISRNTNEAFELVAGEFIALLDHDDTLTAWALFEVVKRLQINPELDLIYSDKDSITADGQIRLNALFKPEWSPEMLHSVNYLTHLNIIRSSLVREIGGWRPETDGAQDWDLFFRITERTKNIARIPSILYHWRILPTSTATGLAAKPYAAVGQLKAQQDSFLRRGLSASVVPSPEGMFRVCWPVREASTSIAVFQTGTLEELITVLDVLRAGVQTCIKHIYVVHSTPVTAKLDAFKAVWHNRITFCKLVSANWCTALELATKDDPAGIVLLLDGSASGFSDTLAEELTGWVEHHPDIAWTSAIALNSNEFVLEAGRVVSADYQSAPLFSGISMFTFGWFGGPLWYRNARACSPYAVAMKSSDAQAALIEIEGNPNHGEDFTKFCLALTSNGRRGLINPFARIYFNRATGINSEGDAHIFHDDPYFNPAFSQVNPLSLAS